MTSMKLSDSDAFGLTSVAPYLMPTDEMAKGPYGDWQFLDARKEVDKSIAKGRKGVDEEALEIAGTNQQRQHQLLEVAQKQMGSHALSVSEPTSSSESEDFPACRHVEL